MSKSESENNIPGLIGKSLVGVTTLALLIILGLFGVRLLQAMFEVSHPEAAAQVGAPMAAAGVVPGPAAKADPVPAEAKASAPPAETAHGASPEVSALLDSGKQTYMICAACHGMDGKTLIPNMAPNLASSEYVNGPDERLAMLVLNGVKFPGKYLGQMVAWKAQLTDEQIAGVLTYIRSNFGNDAPPVFPEMIAAARAKHANRDTPFTREELDAVTTNLTK